MSSPSIPAPKSGPKTNVRPIVITAAIVVLVAAMVIDTKYIKISSETDAKSGVFSAPVYGQSEFPKVQAAIEKRAVDAATLAAAIAKDPAAAGKQYGIASGVGPEIAVKFTGTVGKEDFGVFDIGNVDGFPKTTLIRVQTGPAIMGTDLRDATGTISFGQFTNQIDYQNAGSALNKEMKKQVLSKVDTSNLAGKTISVVGVFQLTDPNNWLVTPVQLEVK